MAFKRIFPIFIALVFSCHKGPHYGGTFYIGTTSKPTSIGALAPRDTTTATIYFLIYNGLINFAKVPFEPDLAKSWDISKDGLVWTVYLKRGIHFHNGLEVTAKDIVHVYQRAIALKMGNINNIIKQIEMPDRYTIRFYLRKPCSSFLAYLILPIIPEKSKGIIGTGPFRWVGQRGDEIILEANRDYFAGRPYIDRVVFKIYKNPTALWSSLMQGKIDFAIHRINPDEFEILKNDPSFICFEYLSPFCYTITYNLSDELFRDKRVRQAISYAINREEIIDIALKGHGRLADGPFYLDSWAINPNAKRYHYNPKRAISLLYEAGWRIEDGVLKKGNKRFVFTLLLDKGDELKEKVAKIIYCQLLKVGIEMRIKSIEFLNLINDYLMPRNFQATFIEYRTSREPDMCTFFWKPPNINENFSGYDGPNLKHLLEEGRGAMDMEKRIQIYQKIHAMVMEDQPATFLFFRTILGAFSKRFFIPRALLDEPYNVQGIRRCYLKG